jgi:hypothetical protein
MRKPRDIDAELKALAEKAKALKSKRTLQLGELVTLTGADALDLETLTGALLAAVESASHTGTKEAWRAKGAGFFQARRGARNRTSEPPAGQPSLDPAGGERGTSS